MNFSHPLLAPECQRLLGSPIDSVQPLSGGSISQAYKISVRSEQYFVKSLTEPPPGMFAAEKSGLQTIAESGTAHTPRVVAQSHRALILEYLQPAYPSSREWRQLGSDLALLHQVSCEKFGFDCDNYCGRTAQINSWSESGHEFFVQNRLLYQGELAVRKNYLNIFEIIKLESICNRLNELIPNQTASLIHGDLWSGNVLFSQGKPWLIDPAVYYGWAEAELAMTLLFGGFDAAFYDAYTNTNSIANDWRERAPLYNLYHLLNHLNMFGAGYYAQVVQILDRYA